MDIANQCCAHRSRRPDRLRLRRRRWEQTRDFGQSLVSVTAIIAALLISVNFVWWVSGSAMSTSLESSSLSSSSIRETRAGPATAYAAPAAPVADRQEEDQIIVYLQAVWYFHHIPHTGNRAAQQAMAGTPDFASMLIRDDDRTGDPHYALAQHPDQWLKLCGRLKHASSQMIPPEGSVIAGHWLRGALCRYPQLHHDPLMHRLFTVIQDPWDTRLTMYLDYLDNDIRSQQSEKDAEVDLVKYMLSDRKTMEKIRDSAAGVDQPDGRGPQWFWFAQSHAGINYLPYHFKCKSVPECQQVLDQYAYIGVHGLPDMPNPLRPLAVLKVGSEEATPLLDRWRTAYRYRNRNASRLVSNRYRKALELIDTPENRESFQRLNALEYWIYREAVRRYTLDWRRTIGTA